MIQKALKFSEEQVKNDGTLTTNLYNRADFGTIFRVIQFFQCYLVSFSDNQYIISPLIFKEFAILALPQLIDISFYSRFCFFQPFLLRKNGFFILSCTLVSVYSESVYGQICGQIRVPNDCHVVLFWGGRSTRKSIRRQRRIAQRAEKKHTNCYMWSNSYREMINMWSAHSSSQQQRTASSFFCRCCIVTQNRTIVKYFP